MPSRPKGEEGSVGVKVAMYNVTTTAYYGGVETFVWKVSEALARRGIEVSILGGRGVGAPTSSGAGRHEPVEGVTVKTFPFLKRRYVAGFGSRIRKFVERLSFAVFSIQELVRGQYHIIHIHKPYDMPTAILAKRLAGAKVVFGSQGTDFFPGDRIFAGGMDAFVACSRFNALQIKDRYGRLPEVIYNGVDDEGFSPVPTDERVMLRTALGVNPDERCIVYAGRLVGWKGVDLLIRAFKDVNETFSSRLFIVGDGEKRAELESLAGCLGISERVEFTGFRPHAEVARYYRASDVAVFPSVGSEAFDISLCEAMACETAVVATANGGHLELVIDAQTGLLVTSGDTDALRCAILRLLKDDGLRQRLAMAARESVMAEFTWDAVAERLARVYAMLLR
ncbi:MAG: glycosyltransferase family 4 protein [Deltaproteobacteria bacterium]|nr:glycosyltransferase family 4 protein [Deltaproteobacteria bacterium]